jgi:hypothetical protein
MLRKFRKSSGRVTLVLLGVAALAGCGDHRRDVYASKEDCLADWGNQASDCSPATDSRHSSRGYWYGPSYSTHTYAGSGGTRGIGRSGTFSSARASGSTSSARGGFGSSGRGSAG